VNTRIKESYDKNVLIKQSWTLITRTLYYIKNSNFVNIVFGCTVIVQYFHSKLFIFLCSYYLKNILRIPTYVIMTFAFFKCCNPHYLDIIVYYNSYIIIFTFALIRTQGKCLIKVVSTNTIFPRKCLVNSFLSCAS